MFILLKHSPGHEAHVYLFKYNIHYLIDSNDLLQLFKNRYKCNVQWRSLPVNPRRLVPDIKSDSLEMLQYVHCTDLITGTAPI
jgi:hypothetical protein